ncbi:alpha-L-arabinofuranosidase C-terminal domain-containing protein [Chondrinema litorale]|uniref:alpha-L-arabinofuranosidase C-terminal domain-containing protein n=1 Tax=Chondrinema litorale TaxID=2994555 RepID=UPI002543507B|nr:alpha-L-arabinofuranosidase C-terminal domain-containing protein [Chondrinema litorale]UZR98803.1 alpha-L-arabinofuranosidase [Chondrinema litorale]
MRINKLFELILCAGLLFPTFTFAQAPIVLEVDASKHVADIQPTMWGIFFEDINFAADGGIYAEMVKNRSFEFDNPLMGWNEPNSDTHSLNEKSGIAKVVKESEGTNPHFARIEVKNSTGYKIINEGFRSMGIKKDAKYNLTFEARNMSGNISKINFQFIDKNGKGVGKASVAVSSKDWKAYSASWAATETVEKAQLEITFEGTGVIDVDMISLFPEDTWKGRPKGMRKDLVQLLADLQPGFLRFPGGCIVEGRTLNQRYQWKKTVGNIEDREMIVNRWNTEFAHRPTPDYFQTFGLGFFEYFQLSEDLGAEALPILSCGMACQFNTGELVPMAELDPYVQDALDLIEFANGATSTKWGKLRADMGHPEPFNLKYIGVGNEQWGPDYFDRLKVFIEAIKGQYPEMIVVSGTGPFPDGEQFDYAEIELRKLNAEIVDEHYYRSPEWFLENADRYDSYDRNSYKIFAGEYAAQSVAIASPDNKNNWQCAMSEAAYLTGLERNADVVYLTSYAPLFAHVEGWQWTPDLIWFNNLTSYGTPNYYVQKLFSNNSGTKLISVESDDKPLTGQNSIYASSVLDEDTKEIIVKVVNSSEESKSVKISLKGAKRPKKEAALIVLNSKDLNGVNSIEDPASISPEEKTVSLKGRNIELELPPYSLSVIKVVQQ